MVEIEKSWCLFNREFPEFFKTHPTFILRSNFKASRTLKPKRPVLLWYIICSLKWSCFDILTWLGFTKRKWRWDKRTIFWFLFLSIVGRFREYLNKVGKAYLQYKSFWWTMSTTRNDRFAVKNKHFYDSVINFGIKSIN